MLVSCILLSFCSTLLFPQPTNKHMPTILIKYILYFNIFYTSLFKGRIILWLFWWWMGKQWNFAYPISKRQHMCGDKQRFKHIWNIPHFSGIFPIINYFRIIGTGFVILTSFIDRLYNFFLCPWFLMTIYLMNMKRRILKYCLIWTHIKIVFEKEVKSI